MPCFCASSLKFSITLPSQIGLKNVTFFSESSIALISRDEIWFIYFSLNFNGMLISFFVSVSIGIFFGFYPAVKAAKLDPVVALQE